MLVLFSVLMHLIVSIRILQLADTNVKYRQKIFLRKNCSIYKAKFEAEETLKEGAVLFHDRTVEDLRE